MKIIVVGAGLGGLAAAYRLGRKGEPDIPGIAKAWQEIRKPRVERIKAYARWNTAMFSGDLRAPSNDVERRAVKSLKDVAPDMSAKFHSSRFLKWTLDYDAIADVCPLTAQVHQGAVDIYCNLRSEVNKYAGRNLPHESSG